MQRTRQASMKHLGVGVILLSINEYSILKTFLLSRHEVKSEKKSEKKKMDNWD